MIHRWYNNDIKCHCISTDNNFKNDLRRVNMRNRSIWTVITILFMQVYFSIPASAESYPVQGNFSGYGAGYKGVIDGRDAFQRIFKIGESAVPVYALSYSGSVPTDPNIIYTASNLNKININNIGKISNLAANSSSYGKPLVDSNSEAVAVQLAIWKLSEGVDISSVGKINVEILARANDLLEKIIKDNTEMGVEASLTISNQESKGSNTITIFLKANGKPLASKKVMVFARETKIEVITNTEGIAMARLPGFATVTDVSASFRWSLPAGIVLVPSTGKSVITASPSTIVTTASTKISNKKNTDSIISTKPNTEASPTPIPSTSASPETSESIISDPAVDVIEVTTDKPFTPSKKTNENNVVSIILGFMVLFCAVIFARRRVKS